MNAVWQERAANDDAMPGVAEIPAYDPRYTHSINVYGGRTDLTPNFADRSTHLMNSGLGPSRVPVAIGTLQLNDVKPQQTAIQGFTARPTAATMVTQQPGTVLRETGVPPAPVPVHEPSYYAPGEWWGR